MSNKNAEIEQKQEVVQAVLIADNFNSDFLPICKDIPLALLPVVNKPLIEYTLEFLSLGGIEETFVFCCTHVDAVKKYITKSIKENSIWSQTMKVIVVVSESCRSFGDCLRDLDAKGLLRGNFVLSEPGVISNIKLLPIIKKHSEITKKDKGAAMTLIFQKAGIGQYGRCPREEILIASNSSNRILLHKRLGLTHERKINFPLEIFLENPSVSIQHNLKDTHVAICSTSVLPLFSDNFDFQTRDDFIKGLLMNEEILGSTIYCHVIKGTQHGGAVTNWRMYQAISQELINRWFYPIVPIIRKTCSIGQGVVIGNKSTIPETSTIVQSVIGDNVKIGKNVRIESAYIMSDVKIGDDCIIRQSVVGPKCVLKAGCKVTIGSVLGSGVELNKNTFVENTLVQSTKSADYNINDKLSDKAYRLKVIDDYEEDDVVGTKLARRFSRLHLDDEYEKSDDDVLDSSDSDDDELSHTNSPVPDDTNMFFTEVIDSLARGFEDKLQCDNLILEINSSRYAYNVTLKEVNYNVVKAVLNMPFQHSTGQPYLPALLQSLVYFSPILKNYIRNENAMDDCLQAVEDVASSSSELCECVAKVLNWFYDKDHLTEEIILLWFKRLDKGSRVHARASPFINWLQEAEEASSSDESD